MESPLNSKQDLCDLVARVLPNSNRIIIAVDERQKITKAGIKLAQSEKGEDETLIGTVLSVGKGYFTESGQFIATTSKVGDRVLIDRMSGITIRVDRQGKILPFNQDINEDRLPVRICRQESILWTFPDNWQL